MVDVLRPSDLSRFDQEIEPEPTQEEDEPLEAVDPRTGETSAWLVWPAIAIPVVKIEKEPKKIEVRSVKID